jgi:hypothetical protein
MNELKTDKDTFDNSQCPVKINYITNGNDNTLTTVKYLLSKLYYYETKDEGLKCIVYDEQKDNYKLFNIQSSMTKESVSTIMLSLFKSQAENTITEEPNELNAVSKCPKINTYESELNLKFFDFNYNENKFLDKSIESKSIIDFKNKFFESDKYRPKYEFFKEKDFSRNASYWNNDFDAYHAAVKTLTEDNAIVINTTGEITRKPGNFICVAVDRTANNITNDSPEDLKELKERYKSLEGVYIIAKVRHIITPGQVQGDKQRYRQNLVVMRNFVNK